MKKFLSIILVCTLVILTFTSVLAEKMITDDTVLRVAVNAEFPPFEYMENGNYAGFDIDLMNEIGERTGYQIEYSEFVFDRLLPAVASGEVDCAISSITVTEERDFVIDYTTPYLTADVNYDGEESIESYAVVFPSHSKEKAVLKAAAGESYTSVYTLVNDAIEEMVADGTVSKLIEKHQLNKSSDNENKSFEYYVPVAEKTEITDKEIQKYDTWEEIGLRDATYSQWAESDISKARSVDIIENGKVYEFKKPVSREAFCEMIYNLILGVNKEISSVHPNNYTDTTNRKMLVLAGLGIINGKSDTELAPNDSLTREEAATIIIRAINKAFPMAVTEMWFEYNDAEQISAWASDAVQLISNLGFMNGIGDNKFAPKVLLTAEQAIATLVRVYERADMNNDNKEGIGIIGGADGPTSIIVEDNVKIPQDDDYDKYYADIMQNTTKVDKFYKNEAIRLIAESGKLAADREYISMYTNNDSITDRILAIGNVEFDKPTDIFCLSANQEKILSNIKAIAGDEAENIDFEKMEKIYRRQNFSTLASLINSSYGAENLAALTVLTNSRGYVMPKDFKDAFALYVQYEGEYSAIVSFSKFGDGVISANMSFVRNGEKDNVFRRLYEIGSVVGEDGITVSKVK